MGVHRQRINIRWAATKRSLLDQRRSYESLHRLRIADTCTCLTSWQMDGGNCYRHRLFFCPRRECYSHRGITADCSRSRHDCSAHGGPLFFVVAYDDRFRTVLGMRGVEDEFMVHAIHQQGHCSLFTPSPSST